MPPRLPKPSDFPNLTVTITPPPSASQQSQTTTTTTTTTTRLSNILLLLHGLGDTIAPYTALARQLNLPETAVLVLQAPTPLPFDLGGFHWGDDVIFDDSSPTAEGGLDPDAGFERAGRALDAVLEVLLDSSSSGSGSSGCGFAEREVVIWGVGQGGSVALGAGTRARGAPRTAAAGSIADAIVATAAESKQAKDEQQQQQQQQQRVPEFGGIISLGGALPSGTSLARKARTPVLICGGSAGSRVPDEKVDRVKACFEFVEKARWRRKGDGMPKDRDEMMPIMRFLARRLRSRAGVPEGSVEVG